MKLKSQINKYIKALIIGVSCGFLLCMFNGSQAYAYAKIKRITRLPMKKQLSLKETKTKCVQTALERQKKDSKITLNERKALCYINYAKLGQVNAQYILGKMYAHAHKQYVAEEWLKKAFEAKDRNGMYIGNPEAGFEIATMYLNAFLFNKNLESLESAYMWLTHSAMKGSKYAKVGLARLYMKYKNYEDAYIWYKVAELDTTKIDHDIKQKEANYILYSLSDSERKDAQKNIDAIMSRMPIKIKY